MFGISGYLALVTLYCHTLFWGTEGWGGGEYNVYCFPLGMANLLTFIHNGGI